VDEVMIPILGILLVMIPVAGLTLILTARFALKPLVETLAKALRESGFSGSAEEQARLGELSDQVQALSDQIARMERTLDFDRKLLAGRGEAEPD
jgi:hypothetical protein